MQSKDKLAIVDGNVKHLRLLLDADKNGKIETRVDEPHGSELDKEGSGELDSKELKQSRLATRHAG